MRSTNMPLSVMRSTSSRRRGRVDVSFNLIGVPLGQGTPLADLSIDDFTVPIAAYVRTHLLMARAAARHMLEAGSGVIQMMITTPDRLAIPFVGPFGVMCAAVEALSRPPAAELGRMASESSACGRPGHRRPPGVQWAFTRHAEAAGKTRDEFQTTMEDRTMFRRLTTLAEVADLAAFMASDRASATMAAAPMSPAGS
jgi:NAD(P)-dependent dehydrogenase (short-subunit alcohol dehydrogenase family)